MKGILNENTETIHKYEQEAKVGIQTACGAVSMVPSDQLQKMPVKQAVEGADISKCGRCFDEGNGY